MILGAAELEAVGQFAAPVGDCLTEKETRFASGPTSNRAQCPKGFRLEHSETVASSPSAQF